MNDQREGHEPKVGINNEKNTYYAKCVIAFQLITCEVLEKSKDFYKFCSFRGEICVSFRKNAIKFAATVGEKMNEIGKWRRKDM